MRNSLVFLGIFISFVPNLRGQVGIGSNTPDSSALLDLVASNRGFLPPRVNSDTVIDNPADGLVIYDESDDCLNVFDGSDWVNLCNASNSSGTSGSGVTPINGENRYSWGTPLRFTQIMMPMSGLNNSMVTATSTDSNAYVWGREKRQLIRRWRPSTDNAFTNASTSSPATGEDEHLISPRRLDDAAFNGKVKAFYNVNDAYAIHTTDGQVFTFGHKNNDLQNETAGSFNSYFIKTRPLEMPTPSASETVRDFKINVSNYYIITSDGRAYFRGSGLGGKTATTDWKLIAPPTGSTYATGFEYTAIFNKNKAMQNQLFMKGNDDKIYAAGSTNERVFGPNYDDNNTDPTQSSGIVEIPLPAGVSEKVVRMKATTNNVAAITSDGEIYAWGAYKYTNTTPEALAFKIDPSVTVPPDFSLSSNVRFIKEPSKIAPPAGESTLLDIDFSTSQNVDEPTVVVGGSGTVYLYGGRDGRAMIIAENTSPSQDYTVSWSADGVEAKEAYISGQIYSYLDANGQYLHHGAIVNSGGTSSLYNEGSSNDVVVALPITDGTKDSTNLNP